MISKKDIIKMAHDIFHKSNGRVVRRSTHPVREWSIGLFLFVAIVAVGGFVTAQKYQYYSTLEHSIDDTTKKVKEYNEEAAESALQIFSKKQADFNVLASPKPTLSTEIDGTASSTTDEIISNPGEQDDVVGSTSESASSEEGSEDVSEMMNIEHMRDGTMEDNARDSEDSSGGSIDESDDRGESEGSVGSELTV